MVKLTNLEDCRMLIHENNGPEIRFINDDTGEVYYQKLTDQQIADLASYLNKVTNNYYLDREIAQ